MATVQEPAKSSLGKYERFVNKELSRATRRVQFLDFARAALGLLIATMAYGLVMMLLDKWLTLPQMVRQFGLLGYGVFLIAYGWFVLLRPFRRRVNPYYAAVQVEQTVPDAKNSLVNWLDLHDDDRLGPAVLNEIGQRAAADLNETDIQQAIRSNALMWLGGATVVLLVAFLVTFGLLRPDQFRSLVSRTFSPFDQRAIAKQTTISIVAPSEGNVTVPINRAVTITVAVNGRIPAKGKDDSVRLQMRRSPDDPNYEALDLEQSSQNPAEWSILVPPHVVSNGFYYRVVGGDDATPEYRVQTHAPPSIKRFEGEFKYRPYLGWEARKTIDPNIEEMVGTEVTLDAFTNRTVRDGRMFIDGVQKPIAAELIAGEPTALRFKFKIERDAKYRIWFTATDDESNNDPLPYTIKALRDQIPEVAFTKPEELAKPDADDLKVPADGTLKLEGFAQDDFGITRMTLRMKLEDTVLEPKPYLTENDYKLDTGGYMRKVEYKDFIDLMKLKTPGGLPVKPATGMILECWLEAEDNFDDPASQVGSTRHFKVRIIDPEVRDALPPEDKQKKQEERDNVKKNAAQEKADHDKKHQQDRKLENQQDQKRREERQEQQAKRDQEIQKKMEEQRRKDEAKRNQDRNADNQKNQPEKGAQGQPGGQDDQGNKENQDQENRAKQAAEELQKRQDAARSSDSNPMDMNPTGAEPNPMDANKQADKSAAGKQVEKLVEQMKSDDPKEREEAAKKFDELLKKMAEANKNNQKPENSETNKEIDKALEQLKKGDSKEQQEAAKKLEELMKKMAEANKNQDPGRPENQNQNSGASGVDRKVDDLVKQMNSGDPKAQEDAAKKLAEMMKQMQANQQQNPQPGDSAKQAEKLGEQMKNGNAQEQQQAAQKFADMMKKQAEGNKGQNPQQTDAAKQAEKLADQMKNGNPQERQEAAKKLGEMMKQMAQDKQGQNGNKNQQPQNTDQAAGEKEIAKLMDQMKNGNPQERQDAAKKLGEKMKQMAKANQGQNGEKNQNAEKGQGDQETAKLLDQMKNGNDQQRQEAAKKLEEKMKQMAAQGNQGQQPQPNDAAKQAEKLAEQMKNGNPQQQQEAAQKLADMMKKQAEANQGQNPQQGDAAKQAEKLAQQMKNGNAQERQEAAKKLQDMAKQMAQEGNKGQQQQGDAAAKEAEKLAQQMKNGNPQEKQEAAKKFAEMMKQMSEQANKGQPQPGDAGKQAEKLAEQMKNGNPQQQQEAAKKFAEMMKKQADGNKGQNPQQGEAAKEAAKLAEQMKNGNPQQQADAAKKLGDMMKQMAKDSQGQGGGKSPGDAAKQAEQLAKDMQSGDPKKSQDAAKKLQEMMKQTAEGNKGQQPGQKGEKGNGELAKEMSKLLEQMKNGDAKTREEAVKKFGDIMKQMAQGNKGQQPQKGETDKEIAKQIDKMMKETDPKTREELARQIADAMKQMAKGQLDQDRQKAKQDEQAINDLAKQMAKETDPKTREQMGQKLAEMMKDQENRGGSLPPEERGPIAGPNQDYKNRSGDLKLESLDKETLKKVYQKYNITEDDLKRFLANQAKKKTDQSKPNKNNLQTGSRAGQSVLNQGTRRVEGTQDQNPSELSRGRTGSAPPEYKDAAEKFSKTFGEQQKPKSK